jgi:Txe/YoeB family toxin of Txe-Axe toxin-antitoxin module
MRLKICPLSKKLEQKIKRHGLEKKLAKQLNFLKEDPFNPGLRLELLEPKNMGIYSFRIDKKYRALFFFRSKRMIEIINITTHYR